MFLNVCTTGQVQMNRYFVGKHVSNGINKMTYEIKWFIRDFIEKAMMQNNGAVISGSVTDVMHDVEVGSDVRVLYDGYAATMNSVHVCLTV
ncbi:hypothetical protein DPMN_183182 [Dreissena polymorpha]|uniref:Uncharacterized protein n=1 Tax=Dreissena polymorpha TaxID=45954 RepID=A0A9D4DIK4_DREPO|nr:hypothetical protein DPMN_183182 [Dreissena polymorpha]